MKGTYKHTEAQLFIFNIDITWKGKYRSADNTKQENKEENLIEKMEISPIERHT